MNRTETKPVTKLVDLCIDEISFCTKGANDHALVAILKNADDLVWKPGEIEPDNIVVESAIYPTRLASQKCSDVPNLKSIGKATQQAQSEAIMEEDSMDFAKAEQTLDQLVQKRMAQHENESEAVAMTNVLETAAGKACYRAMTYAKDIEFAKGSTLLTYENRVEKVGGHSAPEREAAVTAWAELDRLARELSFKTGQPYYTAYMNVIDSPQGKKLYAAGLAKPSVAGTAA